MLVAGGFNGGAVQGKTINNTELYDTDSGLWVQAPSLKHTRSGHTATLLSDGRVLVAGGFDTSFTGLYSAEIFSPASTTWVEITSMNKARAGHSATLFENGQVLMAGGFYLRSHPHNSVEIFNPES